MNDKEPELPPTIHKIEKSPIKHILDCEGEELELYWDGFCFTVESKAKFAFVASVNDPSISNQGNASIIFGTPEEIAQRLPT